VKVKVKVLNCLVDLHLERQVMGNVFLLLLCGIRSGGLAGHQITVLHA
jgi:hypothetical protein